MPPQHPPFARRSRASAAWLLVALALLSGCGTAGPEPTFFPSSDPPPPPAAPLAGDPPPATVASAAATPAAAIDAIVWTTATDPTTGEPAAPVDRFSVDAPAIIAAVPLAPSGTDRRLRATWRYNNTPLAGLDSEVAVAAADGRRWVAFSLVRAATEPWPDGTYEVAVSADDRPLRSAAVTVDGPD